MPPRTYADLLSLIKPNDPGGPINAPFLPPTATWEDAKRDPIKTLADLIIGAVDPWNQPKGLNAGSLGGLLGAMVPLLKAGKLAESVAAEKAGAQGAEGITAYHGSPHDFDQFSLSKIGTGEGAQAYGHGLYFAENESVARNYRDTLASAQRATSPVKDSAHVAAAKDFLAHGYSPQQTLDGLREAYKSAAVSELEAALREARGLDAGRMYEVRINANPDQMLDWDARIADQPQAVRDALKRNPYFNEMGAGGTGRTVYNELQTVAAERSGIPERVPSAASAELQRIGIPGIKYLDGGSRAAGEGSRNFVIFDDSLVTILKKYGVALPVIEALRRKATSNNGIVPAADVHGAIG